MKKRVVFILCLLFSFASSVKGQFIETSFNLNGTWSDWSSREVFFSILYRTLYKSDNHNFTGFDYFDLRTYSMLDINRDVNKTWCFRILIEDYVCPDKKEIKKHYKSNQWYEYTGWVEYYVTDEYPTIKDVLKRYGFPLISLKGDSQRALRHAKATIKIAPYKNKPECFNIFFDSVGVAVACTDWKWFWQENINVTK